MKEIYKCQNMETFFKCFIHQFVILTSLLSSVLGKTVLVAKLLEDGHVKTFEDPTGKRIEFPDDYDGTALTICFWIHPYRYLNSNNIFSFSPSPSEFSTISIFLQEGSLSAKIMECELSLNTKLQIREWSHYCLSIEADVEVYTGGALTSSNICDLSRIFRQNQKSTYFRIGWDAQMTIPLSGLVADARLYWEKLSDEEIRNISSVQDIISDFEVLLNSSSDDHSRMKFENVDSEELLDEYMPYILLYISEANTYKKAERVCAVRQSLLPDLSFHGKETLTKLFLKFATYSSISFGSFWLKSVNESGCFSGTFITRPLEIKESNELCNSSQINYFCVVDKNVNFNLIGFQDDFIVFHPVPYEYAMFESVDVYRLYVNYGSFLLKDVRSDYTFFKAEGKEADKIIGRYNWFKDDNSQIKKEMTFSSCDFKDFTCSDGMCVPFDRLCQFQGDCEDFSDESVSICEVGIPPRPFYDKRLPPSHLTNYTTNISINFELLGATGISIDDSTFSILVMCALSWKDHRLEFKFLKPNESNDIAEHNAEKYWQPDLEIKGAIQDEISKLSFKDNPGKVTAVMLEEGTLEVITSFRAKYYDGDKVLITCENTVTLTLSCQMGLFYFPFDRQTCSFTLQLVNDLFSDIQWDTHNSNISMAPGVFLPVYEISDFKYNFTDPKSLEISVRLERKFGAFIFNTILPGIILELIGIVSHLIPTNDYNDRITVVLNCLIVMATIFAQVSGSLPESASPKLIDVWMFAHILVLLEVYIDHIIVIHLDDVEAKATENMMNGKIIQNYMTKNLQIRETEEEQEEENSENTRTIPSKVKIAWENIKNSSNFPRFEFPHFEMPKYDFSKFTASYTNKVLYYINIVVYAIFLLFFYLVAERYIEFSYFKEP